MDNTYKEKLNFLLSFAKPRSIEQRFVLAARYAQIDDFDRAASVYSEIDELLVRMRKTDLTSPMMTDGGGSIERKEQKNGTAFAEDESTVRSKKRRKHTSSSPKLEADLSLIDQYTHMLAENRKQLQQLEASLSVDQAAISSSPSSSPPSTSTHPSTAATLAKRAKNEGANDTEAQSKTFPTKDSDDNIRRVPPIITPSEAKDFLCKHLMVEDEGKTDTHDVLSKTACVESIHRAKDVDMTENSAAADDHILMSFEGDEEIDMEELRRQGFDFDEGEYEIVYVDASEDETDESQTQSVNLDSSNTQMNNVQMESDGTDDLPTPPRLARSFSAPPRSYYFTPFTESSAAASASASSLPSSSATSAASLYKERKARLSAPLSYTPKHRLQDTRPAQRQRCYHCAGHKYYCCGPFTNLSESVHITSADAMGADGDDYATADDARADTDDAGLSDLSFSWRKHCGYLNRHHRVKYHGDIRYRPPTPHPRSLPLSNSNTKGHAVESIDDSSTGAARWMTSLTSIDDYLYSHYHAPSKV